MFRTVLDMTTGEVEQVPLTPEEIAALTPTLEQARDAKLADLAARRWQAETGGMLIGGMPVKTDRESIAKIMAAYVQAQDNPTFSVNWKVDAGVFVPLDAATLIVVGDAVTTHVQACFDKEMAISAEIMTAPDIAALDAIDIETGWPGVRPYDERYNLPVIGTGGTGGVRVAWGPGRAYPSTNIGDV